MADKQKDSIDWFKYKASSAAGYRKNIIGRQDRVRDDTVIGKLYFFYYDPKHKDKLPIYDRFPLVFPIEGYSDGFLGLNLHYLYWGERKALLDQLMKYRSDSRMDERTRLKLSYQLLANTKKLRGRASTCIKRYLTSHVVGRFIEITPNEWEYALNLPVEIFVTKR
jgi:hypothetical protein